MDWPYRFVDLNDAQKLERRLLLDKYANIAQLSALVPLLAVQFYFLLSWLGRRGVDGASPGSPRLKEERSGRKVGLLRKLWIRFSWWCGEPVDVGSLGSRGAVLFAVIWFSWLLSLCFPETGDDYLHLTKRFGIVAASQLPLHYLLAMKSPYSPLQILTRASHETLNTFHQLSGRVILTLLYLHVSFYLNFYIQKDLLASKIKETYILCGLFGITSLTVLGTTAMAPIRKLSYRLFYMIHITVAGAILCVMPFHVSHIRLYIYESAAVYVLNVILRTWKSRKVYATLKRVPNTNMIEINVRFSETAEDKELRRTTQPGHHAYVLLTESPSPQVIRNNPFSVSSVPSTDGRMRFIARIMSGNTALIDQATSPTKISNREIAIEGPYGVNHSEKLLQYDRVLFVAGGIGGTFIVPLYRQLLADLSPSRGSHRRQKVSFVWIAQKMADVAWALPLDSKEKEDFAERLQIYLTKASPDDYPTSKGSGSNNEHGGHWLRSQAERDDDIELEERKNLLSSDSGDGKGTGDLFVEAGRPDLKKLVGNKLSHSSHERIAVFVCGPESLNRGLRAELRKWASRGTEIFYWEEKFAL